jgi:hypothetical protein
MAILSNNAAPLDAIFSNFTLRLENGERPSILQWDQLFLAFEWDKDAPQVNGYISRRNTRTNEAEIDVRIKPLHWHYQDGDLVLTFKLDWLAPRS